MWLVCNYYKVEKKTEKEEKEMKKDNQYKFNKAMALPLA